MAHLSERAVGHRRPRATLAAVVLAFVTVLAAAPTASVAAGRNPVFVGVQDDFLLPRDTQYRSDNLGSMSSIGIGLLRQPFLWREIETTPGTFDFSRYDEFVGHVSSMRIKILGVIFGPPSFRMQAGPAKYTCPPNSNDEFAGFAAALARRYGSRGTYWSEHPEVPRNPVTTWQIWNEPNIRPYWCGKPNARQYVAMLRAANKALKAADPRTETVTAGIPKSKLGIPIFTYLRQLYRAGAKQTFDTLAINPYSRTVPELKTLLRRVRRLMNAHNDRRAKIWVTELGWADKGPGSPFTVGAKRQASRITAAYRMLAQQRSALKLRGVVYTFWRDLPPYPPVYKDFWSLHTGLLRQDGSVKASFRAFAKAIKRFR